MVCHWWATTTLQVYTNLMTPSGSYPDGDQRSDAIKGKVPKETKVRPWPLEVCWMDHFDNSSFKFQLSRPNGVIIDIFFKHIISFSLFKTSTPTKWLGWTSTFRHSHCLSVQDSTLEVLQTRRKGIVAQNDVVPDNLIGIHLPFQAYHAPPVLFAQVSCPFIYFKVTLVWK